MAVKKPKTKAEEKIVEETGAQECCGKCCEKKCCGGKLMTASWMILLIAGLGHMMPAQLAPILGYAVYGITVQTVVGVLAVVAALYYLLEE